MELREVVYHIYRIRGFSFLGKLAYLFCYRLVSLLFWLTPEIRCVYVAGSMASWDFVPGLSDIDFVVVIKEMSAKDEYKFLKNLDKRIRYLMPPFGKEKIGTHIYIYSSQEWAILGDLLLGKRFGSARLVFEKENITLKNEYSQFIKGLHHFYKGQWKLEVIQQYLFLKKNQFSMGLLERAIERSILSIEFAFYEINQNFSLFHSYSNLQDQINAQIEDIRRSKIKGSFESTFFKLNYLFHVVLENSCCSYLKDGSSEIGETQTLDYVEIRKLRTKELVDEIHEILKVVAARHSILVSRTEKADYFLFDPQCYETSNHLTKHYRNRHDRVLRMYSRVWFEKLHLNFPTPPLYFFDLHDRTEIILKGSLDNNRLIIEAYSVFPKVRSLNSLKNPSNFQLVLDQIVQQITILEGQTKAKENDEASRNDPLAESQRNWTANNEFERFSILKLVSLILREKMPEFLSIFPDSSGHNF